jgi:HEAT repeat protein
MNALVFVWALSLVLSLSAVLAMAILIAARIVRGWREATRAEIKNEMTRELMLVVVGKTSELSRRKLSQREQAILAGTGIELLDLVRGETALSVVQMLTACGVKSVLARWIRSPNPLRRATAAESLAYFSDQDGQTALNAALRDANHDVRLAAATSLVKLGAAPPLATLVDVLRARGTPSARLGQILELTCAREPDQILRLAQDPKVGNFVRSKAIEVIAATGEAAVVPHLIAFASDGDADIRTSAIRGLGGFSHPASAQTIRRAFDDPAWFVRAAAAEAAGRTGLYELVPPLTALVDDNVWWVRFRASEALIALDEAGRSALRSLAARHRGRAGRAAAEALAERAYAS